MAGEEPVGETADTAQRTGGLVGNLTGAIGWFASSLGVIGALLYACGYLISVAQLHLLGLGRVMSYGHDFYVQEGGLFFAGISSIVATMAVYSSAILIIFAVAGFGLMRIWRKTGLEHRQWIDRIWKLDTRVVDMWRPAAYAVLFCLLVFVFPNPAEFGSPLMLSNVLVTEPAAPGSDLVTIHKFLLAGNKDALGGIFEGKLNTVLGAVFLFLAIRYITSGWKWRLLALAPFVLMLTIYSLLLPMLYGVLKLQVEFPVVMIWPGEGARPTEGQRSFLLNLGEHDVVLYAAPERKIMWRRHEHIDRLDVIGEAPILKEIPVRKVVP